MFLATARQGLMTIQIRMRSSAARRDASAPLLVRVPRFAGQYEGWPHLPEKRAWGRQSPLLIERASLT
jgi:hypothetical protein